MGRGRLKSDRWDRGRSDFSQGKGAVRLLVHGFLLKNRVDGLAVVSAKLACTPAEIDDKLPSNSS